MRPALEGNNNATTIKPCPFCFAKWEDGNLGLGYWPQPATHYYVGCLNCGARGPEFEGECAPSWNAAVRAWNEVPRP